MLGPVEVVVIGFPENRFNGRIIPEVETLIDRGIINVVDGVLIRKDALGGIQLIEFDEPTLDIELGRFQSLMSDIVHDLVVAPIAALIAIVVIRRAPAITRAPLRAALFGSAVVVAVAWPALRGYGRMRTPDNASVQPLNYATAVATVVAVVWVISALWLGVIWIRKRDHLPA